MENRDHIYSDLQTAGKRTYFFDLKYTVHGKPFLKITESVRQKGEEKSYKRYRIMVFPEDLKEFHEKLEATLRVAENTPGYPKKEYPKGHHRQMSAQKISNGDEFPPPKESLNLRKMYREGKSIQELAEIFECKPGEIRSKLNKMGVPRRDQFFEPMSEYSLSKKEMKKRQFPTHNLAGWQ